jgi:hypothetical protein
VGIEAVEPGAEDRVDRRRNRAAVVLAVRGEHRLELLDEERVSLGRRSDPLLRAAAEPAHELGGLLG